jgi:hypothetical protein
MAESGVIATRFSPANSSVSAPIFTRDPPFLSPPQKMPARLIIAQQYFKP